MSAATLHFREGTWLRFKKSGLPANFEGPYRVEKSWDPKKYLVASEHSNKIYILVDATGKKFTYSRSSADAIR